MLEHDEDFLDRASADARGGAENDTIASVASHSIPFYTSLPSSLDKAYAELNNASHLAPNTTNTPIGRYSVAGR